MTRARTRVTTRARRLPAPDQGSILPLVAGMIVLIIGFVAVAVDVLVLHQQHGAAERVADAAARAGAQALDLPHYYRHGGVLRIDPAQSRELVRQFLRAAGDPWRMEAIDVTSDRIRVTITTAVLLPFSGVVTGAEVPVRATSTAQLRALGGP